MALFDKVKDGALTGEVREAEAQPTSAPNKGAWLPRYYPNPEFEPGPGQDEVVTVTIEADRVVYTKTGVDRPIADLRAERLAALTGLFDAKFTAPFAWDFGAVTGIDDDAAATGALGAQTLQMRLAPVDDQKNWLAAQAGATTLIVVGAGGEISPLKTTSNIWAQTTATQAIQVLVTGDGEQEGMLARQLRLMARHGQLKKAIADAADYEALAAIDLTEGW